MMIGLDTLDWDQGLDYKKIQVVREWQENKFSLPATVAGRLDKLLTVKTQIISTNFKSLSQLFQRQKTWRTELD